MNSSSLERPPMPRLKMEPEEAEEMVVMRDLQVRRPDLVASLESLKRTIERRSSEEQAAAEARYRNICAMSRKTELEKVEEATSKYPAEVAFDRAWNKALAECQERRSGRKEAARHFAKAVIRFLVPCPDGLGVERLTGLFLRYGHEACKEVGRQLAGEMQRRPKSIGNPLAIFDYRCKEARNQK